MQTDERKTYRLEGEITMRSPLSHIGESHGTDSYLAEQIIIGPDGQPEEVFVYSGNAFRGMMRDLGTKYLLDRLGGLQVPLETFHLLFSGGSLGSETHVDVERARLYRRVLPLFSIFGGGTGNQILEGKLRVGQMYPITRETLRVIPTRYHSDDLPSWRQWTMEQSFTRMDDTKDERLRGYLASNNEGQLQLEGESRGRRRDEPAQQMRYTVEAMAPGSVFWQRIDIMDVSELELGAWVSCLAEWSKSPYLGGKSNVGFGLADARWDYVIPDETDKRELFAEIADSKCLMGPAAQEAKERYDQLLLAVYERYLETDGGELRQLLGGAS